MSWRYTGMNDKSDAEINQLAGIHQHPCFRSKDLTGFTCAHEAKLLDQYLQDQSNPLHEEFGWCQSSEHAPELKVPGVYHHSLTSIIWSTFKDDIANRFHMTPYSQYWKVSEMKTVQVFSESYSSPAMLDAYAEINSLPHEPDDDLERVLAPLMMWSDETHLTSFGDALLWPFYLFFGKPTSFASYHVAYIPMLSDNTQEIYCDIFGEAMIDEVHMFCKHELVQAIWKLLLDKDFMHAYEHGMIVHCTDGITHCLFPHFFSYSADYPEKVLLVSIKFLGQCLCPCCLVKKCNVPKMGTKLDMKCQETKQCLIFELGASVDGVCVKAILSDKSYIPIQNAFSDRLRKFGFNMFILFIVDLLHEFKLGMWKAIFIHLLCILYAQGGNVIQKLNKR
ncbi:hypothetical protein BDR06DRAFT_981715 [Suillus hirtellus]|nr:hypothetical protein BDR06DRAFT_981715 [Suillus hirtellus]